MNRPPVDDYTDGVCHANHLEGYLCSLPKGHSGEHVAWGPEGIETEPYKVWS